MHCKMLVHLQLSVYKINTDGHNYTHQNLDQYGMTKQTKDVTQTLLNKKVSSHSHACKFKMIARIAGFSHSQSKNKKVMRMDEKASILSNILNIFICSRHIKNNIEVSIKPSGNPMCRQVTSTLNFNAIVKYWMQHFTLCITVSIVPCN